MERMKSTDSDFSEAMRSPSEKYVLVLGAGFVSAPAVELLARDNNLHVTIASDIEGPGDELVKRAINSNVDSIVIDVAKNSDFLDKLIEKSDIVISLLPHELHRMIAEKCIRLKKNMVTAGYSTPELKQLNEAAIESGVTILNEVGLDPGIDHLLAMECIDRIVSKGGRIISYVSYCGGLPAPDNADNPLKYKFSWSPKAALFNTMRSAKWIENDEINEIPANGSLMDNPTEIQFLKEYDLEGYPNRDSTIYRDMFGISSAKTVIRGTLRYKGFCNAMKGLQLMNLLDSTPHPLLNPNGPQITCKQFITSLLGHKDDIPISKLKNLIHERVGNSFRVEAIENLGLLEEEPIVKLNTPIDTISQFLSNKLSYKSYERDVIIMRHDIGIEWPNGTNEIRNIDLVVFGDSYGFSAMAKTVGYTTAIATLMLLNGEIKTKGVIEPMTKNIYNPILERLRKEGITAIENSTKLLSD